MTVNVFGVTGANLYTRHFPQWSAPTTDSNPSATAVGEIIDEAAADLEGRLLDEGITASGLTTVTDAAYLWCRETLRLMVAIHVVAVATQQVPAVSAGWQKQLDARWKQLADKGGTALGITSPGTPNGPTHHIDTYDLDIGDPELEASDVIPPFRKSDQQ